MTLHPAERRDPEADARAIQVQIDDSERVRPWRVPHTAFFDDSLPGARTRESIEFRSVAYFL